MPEPRTLTGISLPSDQHALLREAARGRQRVYGGRASVSSILAELVDQHRPSLMADAEKNQLGSAERFR